MKIRGFENWVEVNRQTADDGTQRVSFTAGNHRIVVTEASYMPGGLRIETYPLEQNRYTPSIYVDNGLRKNFQTVSIQTSSWGALELGEIEKVVAAYTEATKIAHEIETAFPDCFNRTQPDN
jgi:hypothetical protein